MLRVSKLTDYGTVVMTYLAHEPLSVRNAAEIAEATCVSGPTVSKILKALAREHLVVSFRGVRGGYALARPPAEISMAQIVAAMEGPIALTECSGAPGQCGHEPVCSVRTNWQRINDGVRIALEKITLAELAQPAAECGPPTARPPHDRRLDGSALDW
jgi:FeS assembly SUF system regulator